MKKWILIATGLVLAAAAVVAYLIFSNMGKPRFPKDTIVAVYIEPIDALENIGDCIDAITEHLPKAKKERIRNSFEEIVKKNKEDIKALNPKWIVGMVCGSAEKDPRWAIVIKCDYKASLNKLFGANDESLQDLFVKKGYSEYEEELEGKQVLYSDDILDGSLLSFVDGKYVIITERTTPGSYIKDLKKDLKSGLEECRRELRNCSSGWNDDYSSRRYYRERCDSLERQIDQYKSLSLGDKKRDDEFMSSMISLYSGDGSEKSSEFKGISDIGGDTIARIMTASPRTILKSFNMYDSVAEIAEASGDKELVDDIMDMSGLVVDIVAGDDDIGMRLKFDAGSREIAKVLEGTLNASKLLSRALGDYQMFKCEKDEDYKKYMEQQGIDSKKIKDLFKLLRDSSEVERSGSTVKVNATIDTEDFFGLLIPNFQDQTYDILEDFCNQLKKGNGCELLEGIRRARTRPFSSSPYGGGYQRQMYDEIY